MTPMNFATLPTVDAASVPGDALVLDVREDDEWAAGHVEGALHVPMSDFVARFGEVTEAVADGRRAYVMCGSAAGPRRSPSTWCSRASTR